VFGFCKFVIGEFANFIQVQIVPFALSFFGEAKYDAKASACHSWRWPDQKETPHRKQGISFVPTSLRPHSIFAAY
jgi:hypothetical protein